MRIITVRLDDYDSPLIGTLTVNDDEVEAVAEELAKHNPEGAFDIEVSSPDDLASIIKEMDDITREDSIPPDQR